jgi:tetratricopeptide (TPR) repeat protein
MKIIRLILLCFIMIFMITGFSAAAQEGTFSYLLNERKARKARRSADVYFSNSEYDKALPQYRKAMNQSRFNDHAMFRAGLCLYHTSQDSLALIEFKKTSLLVDENGLLDFYIARCSQLMYNFEVAIDYYKLEIDKASRAGDAIYAGKLEKFIAECQSGIELMANRKDNITVSRLPGTVNSKWSDYAAFVTDDDTRIFFTSGRPGDGESEIDDDIFFSVKDVTGWTESIAVESLVNTGKNNAMAGFSGDGQKIYVWTDENNGDIFFTSYDGMKWSKSAPLPGMINSPAEESSVCFTASGDTAYFVSNRTGSTGGKDIFFSVRDGEQWMEPVNIGKMINTPFDEESVFVDNDTLYFSSQGHNSMGGYDIFRSVRTGKSWSKPENAGYPVNSTYDDLFYNSAGESAFFSSDRPGGMGKSDIYSVSQSLEKTP